MPRHVLDPVPTGADSVDAALLADRPTVGALRVTIVTAVDDKSAAIYLGGGKAVLDFRSRKWATPLSIPTDAVWHRRSLQTWSGRGSDPGQTNERSNKQVTWRTAQIPRVAGALIALDPDDGAIRALVGGYDFGTRASSTGLPRPSVNPGSDSRHSSLLSGTGGQASPASLDQRYAR